MRLRFTLVHIAILASAGCGGAVTPESAGGPDGGQDSPGPSPEAGAEAGSEGGAVPEAGCSGCNCGDGPTILAGNATPEQACAIAGEVVDDMEDQAHGTSCQAYCESVVGSKTSFVCEVPSLYVDAYESLQGHAGDGGPLCPPSTSDVVITCGYDCTGRRTQGVGPIDARGDGTTGSILAERATLEAVSVQAFVTLERELAAHGAPPSLLRDARRARRDEVRHTAMMSRLARRYGGRPRSCEVAPPSPPRSLFEVAMENAVEGCVRETYGAVVGLVEGRVSSDPDVRRAMRSIAADECRHAELAWAVARWALPRLTAQEREAVERATQSAVEAMRREGDPLIVALLAERVWSLPADAA